MSSSKTPQDHGSTPEPSLRHGLLKPGEHLGNYTIGRKLEEGRLAALYLALKPDGRICGLKVMDATGDTHRVQLWAEYEFLASLRPPSIVRVLDRGEDNGFVYYAIQYPDLRPSVSPALLEPLGLSG